ncbi:hypothetical protein TELCIR_16807, partial [Teladorsagia circumcincta]
MVTMVYWVRFWRNISSHLTTSYRLAVVIRKWPPSWPLFDHHAGTTSHRQMFYGALLEHDRLAVVTLSRSQTYSSLKQVQDELGPFATRFDPRENGGLAVVEGVELDRDVVNVAIQWFALAHQDPRMSVKVMDALVYLEETATRGEKEKLDVLFVDLAGPVHESGLSCPPAVFLTDPVLRNMKSSLKSNGVIAMNLVTRDEEVAHKAKRSVAAHFPDLFSIRSEEDVNE